jgi:hypothetical protein
MSLRLAAPAEPAGPTVEVAGVPAALWRASWWVVRRPALLVPAGLAVLLVVATSPVLDEGYGMRVLRGAGVLLACALVTTVDDPSGEVVAASPFPRAVRTLGRVLAGAALVVTSWAVAAVLVEWRAPEVPVLGLGLEALALATLGLAVATGLRAWRDQHSPSHVSLVAVVAIAFLTSALPRWYTLQQGQTWGPPWEAAQIRWFAVLLVGSGLVTLALRDPLARGRRARAERPVATLGGPG